MSDELEGQVAIVTGGGRGFGRAIAEAFAAAGAAVAVTARSESQLDEVVATIEKAGGRGLAVAGDVADADDVRRVVAATEARFGPVTTFVNTAGVIWPFGPIWLADPEQWWQAHAVHVKAPLLYLNALVPGMVERGIGRVIIVSSGGALNLTPNNSGYTLPKATQIKMAAQLAAEGAEHGIIAFAISPGRADTSMTEETLNSPEAQRWMPDYVARIRGRLGTRDNPAIMRNCGNFCVALASGRYDHLSGQFLNAEDGLPSA